jgi:uncharacterized iron-regulated protein
LRRIAAFLALSLVAACSSPLAEGEGTIFAGGGARLAEAELVQRLAAAEVVILGELHDSPVHHARQARLVRALSPAGLAFEMVPADSEEGIEVFLAQGGSRGAIGPAIGWERLGWPDWELYAPIFEAALGAYVAGGAPARSELRLAAMSGAAAAWGSGAGEVGLDRALDEATLARLEQQMLEAHCGEIPRAVARQMVEAQRYKDARLARAVLRARERGGGQAVLITGNEHARTDRGVPAYVARLAPGLEVASVGMVELPEGADPAEAARGLAYDYVWFSEPIERADPCEGFG